MENENALQRQIDPDQAIVNVTWAGQNGELAEPVPRDATEGDIRQWLAEAIANGSIRGMAADPNVNLRDFVVDRFEPNDARPYAMIMVRPKVPFGMVGGAGIPSTTRHCPTCGQTNPSYRGGHNDRTGGF